MNGLDIITGINSAANTTELYIHDNVFTDMWDGVNLTGNQTVAFSVPTNFFIIGNTFNRPWTASIQTNNAAPVYTEWNFTTNMQYASGAFHNDCEIRLYISLQSGSTYPFGDDIGNICVRGQGQATWADAQGWFSSNGAAGSILSGCKIEGNIYVGTFTNIITLDNCDNTASVDFNTIVQDPVAGIINPNANGTAASSSAGIISKYTTSAVINGQSTYNAVAGGQGVWTGGAPTVTCNKTSMGLGNSGTSVASFAAPPANFTTLQSIAAVSAAFQPKPGGLLLPPSTGCMYNIGTGGYFNYSNRTNSAPY
jgi:hypothetical protein